MAMHDRSRLGRLFREGAATKSRDQTLLAACGASARDSIPAARGTDHGCPGNIG